MIKFIITEPNISKLQDREIPFSINICETIKVSKEDIRKEDFFDTNYDDYDSFIMKELKMELEEAMKYRRTLNKSNRLKDIEIARCIVGMKKTIYTIIDEALFNKKEKHSVILDLSETPRVNIIGVIKLLATSLDFVNREIKIYLCVNEDIYNRIFERQDELNDWIDNLIEEDIDVERVEFARTF